MESRLTTLYRFYGDHDAPLYVGITKALPHRLAQHRAEKAWWADARYITLEHYDSRQEALDAERLAIIDEQPIFNREHNQLDHRPAPWQHLVRAEPRLGEVEREVLALRRMYDKWRRVKEPPSTFCAAEIWYRRVKPVLSTLVGWGRIKRPELVRAGGGAEARIGECLDGWLDGMESHSEESDAEYGFLWSTAAYNAAVFYLNDLMPNCLPVMCPRCWGEES